MLYSAVCGEMPQCGRRLGSPVRWASRRGGGTGSERGGVKATAANTAVAMVGKWGNSEKQPVASRSWARSSDVNVLGRTRT